MGASLAGAQTFSRAQFEAECEAQPLLLRSESEFGSALYRRTPEQTWRRMQPSADSLQYRALGDTVRALWDTLALGLSQDQRGPMEMLLDTLTRELDLLDGDGEFRTREGSTPRFFDLTAGDPGEAWLINAAAGSGAIRLVPDSTPAAMVRAICWTAILARTVAEFGSADARKNTLRVLGERGRRWENFDRIGYSLTPLELLLNGWCGVCRGSLEPPQTQFIALHLSPSYVLRNGLGSRAGITTELAGVLFYNGDRSWYVGASFAFVHPQEERREEGVILHLSKLGQIGVSFRDGKYRRSAASLVLSADLYRFIETWQGTLRQERDEVRRRIAKLRGG